jgi:hypothetical protein
LNGHDDQNTLRDPMNLSDKDRTARQLLCFAEGEADRWQAICVDLDVAVQGTSFGEVSGALELAIAEYLRAAAAEDEPTRRRLLARRAPLLVRLLYAMRFVKQFLFGRNSERSYHGYQTLNLT